MTLGPGRTKKFENWRKFDNEWGRSCTKFGLFSRPEFRETDDRRALHQRGLCLGQPQTPDHLDRLSAG